MEQIINKKTNNQTETYVKDFLGQEETKLSDFLIGILAMPLFLIGVLFLWLEDLITKKDSENLKITNKKK